MAEEKDKEIWEKVPSLKFHYEVSNLGRLRRTDNKQTIEPYLRQDGYWGVKPVVDGKALNKLIHRLVAECFLPNPYNKPEVNHIDGRKDNNKANNLEYVTRWENLAHAIDHGLMKGRIKRIDFSLPIPYRENVWRTPLIAANHGWKPPPALFFILPLILSQIHLPLDVWI